MQINIHNTYTQTKPYSGYMREISWTDKGLFKWTNAGTAKQARNILNKLTVEYGKLTITRHAQGPQWK